MKYLLIILIIIGNCSIKKQKDSNLAITNAQKQSWVAGAGGTKGINYFIDIEVKTKGIYSFDSIWFTNNSTAAIEWKNTKGEILQNEQLTIKAHTHTKTENQPQYKNKTTKPEKSIVEIPKKIKGEALLRYYKDNKTYYLVIKKFTKYKDKAIYE